MFVVAGITGHTGSVVAQTLLVRGQTIRVIVRRPEQATRWTAVGADMAVASLDDADAMAAALKGADGAYLLIPPNYQAQDYLQHGARVTDAFTHAIRQSHVPHVVFLSSHGAQHPSGTGPIRALHQAEQQLRAVSPGLSVLRAPYFMENWLPLVGEARKSGVLPTFLTPDRPIPMVATRDIGHLAAEALLDRAKGVRVCELSGPREYTPHDVADELTRLLHRPVEACHVSLSAVVPTFTQMGFSENVARLFEELYAGIESGRVTYEGGGACRPRGLITLAEVLSAAAESVHT